MKVGTLKARLNKRVAFDMAATLHKYGWYCDGTIAVKLPKKEKDRLSISAPKKPGVIYEIPELIEKYEGYSPKIVRRTDIDYNATDLSNLGVHDPVKKKGKLVVPLVQFGKHRFITCQIDWAESLFPGIKWFQVSKGTHPLLGYHRDKLVALITPVIEDDE